jgi:hypothetical protein
MTSPALEGPSPGGPLTDDEIRNLAILLARYAAHDLDQWDLWRVATPNGWVFIELTNSLRADAGSDAYQTIWPLPERLAEGRDGAEDGVGPWVVWRQDDNGNQYQVARRQSREHAEALAAQLEAGGHKQTYWVSSAAG